MTARDAPARTVRALLYEVARGLLRERLAEDVDEARLQAELLYAHAAGRDRAQVIAAGSEAPEAATLARFERLLERRLGAAPLAYILGKREFYGLRFEVGPGVLIPRPETETLVDATLAAVREHPRAGRPLRVVDVGTGCGAVALAVATHATVAAVLATENSAEALVWAARNRERLGLAERVTLLPGELLAPAPGPLDVVAANLPYVPTAEYEALPAAIREHEPRAAVDGGEDGLLIIRALIRQLPDRLADGAAAVLLEVGAGQAGVVAELLTDAIGGRVLTHRDLLSTRRVVEVRRGY